MQRCHGAPRTCASAAFRPGCASEMASCTPTRPRATSDREELAPERLGLRLADVEADDLAPAGLVDGVRDHDALARNAAAVADLLDLGVDEQIRVAALQRPLAERLDLLVEQPGDPADLALGDPQPEALDELIDPPRRDAADIRLLDDRRPAPARSACAAAGSSGSSCPDGSWGSATRSPPPGCPSAAADSRCDASRGPRCAHRARRRSARRPRPPSTPARPPRTDSRITSACSSRSTCLTTSSIVILSRPAIAGLLSSNRENSDDHERRGGRTYVRSVRPRSYTNPRDVTSARNGGRRAVPCLRHRHG